jgi:SpoVK/Ycf46/Vps4 family AAA+-type ATPase
MYNSESQGLKTKWIQRLPAAGAAAQLPDSAVAELRKMAGAVRPRIQAAGSGPPEAQGYGNLLLFSGPSGTGKTLAAQVLAHELGLEVFRVDVAKIMSKYIGETEKNLSAIFQEAESNNAILFFDEADSLFGKRAEVKDSHDRYANIEVNYLLQLIRTYAGIVILASNQRLAIDAAPGSVLEFSLAK